jgi:hypothetical protein
VYFFILFLGISSISCTFSKLFKNQLRVKTNVDPVPNKSEIVPDPNMVVQTKAQNVKDMILDMQAHGAKDRSALWRNFDDSKLERPLFGGVHNPHDWKPILAQPPNPWKIASPETLNKPKPLPRVIANDLPPKTQSESALDIPKRQNVVQIDLPVSTTKTVSHSIDPRVQLAPDLTPKSHGIEPVKTKFIQVQEAKKPKTATVQEALNIAKSVELQAKKLTESVEVPATGQMLIKTAFTNKRDQPDLKIKTNMRFKEDKPKTATVQEALKIAKDVELQAKKLTESVEVPATGQMLIKTAFTNKRDQPDLKIKTNV